ncbi:MAG: hypothetical protein DHS80DRAFT_32730 [Piptocephalis tieghemiana]|nr:MAG: hypothetical protein DHS80DRAFT_32730 [Piptocephalis tieghemiana]
MFSVKRIVPSVHRRGLQVLGIQASSNLLFSSSPPSSSTLSLLKSRLASIGEEGRDKLRQRRQVVRESVSQLSSEDFAQIRLMNGSSSNLTADDIGSLILELCPKRSVEAFEFLESYQTLRGRRYPAPYNSLVYGLARAGELSKANRVLHAMRTDPHLDRVTGTAHAAYLSQLSSAKGPKAALAWWDKWSRAYPEDKVMNSLPVRNTVNSLFLQIPGDFRKHERAHTSSLKPFEIEDTCGLNIAIKAATQVGRDWERRVRTLQASYTHIPWDAETYRLLIDTASRHRNWSLTDAWCEEVMMDQGLQPSAGLLQAMISSLLTRGMVDKAAETQFELVRQGEASIISPGVYRLWIQYYGRRGDLENAKHIWEMAISSEVVDGDNQLVQAMLEAFLASGQFPSWNSWLKAQPAWMTTRRTYSLATLSPSKSLSNLTERIRRAVVRGQVRFAPAGLLPSPVMSSLGDNLPRTTS